MPIDEQVDQVRSQLPDEVKSKVGSVLETIRSEFADIEDRLSAANSESKKRKIKIRELEESREDLEATITQLNEKINSFDTTAIEQERDQYKNKYTSMLDTQKGHFKIQFEKITKHPKFEHAKNEFDVPMSDDGEIDWEKLTNEQLEKNISALNHLNSLNYFDEAQGDPRNLTTSKATRSREEIKTAKDVIDIRNQYGHNSPQYLKALKEHREAQN